jgi:hypothetical protein
MQLKTNDNTKKFPRNSSRIRAKETASLSKIGSKRSCDGNTRTLEIAREVLSCRSFDCIQRTSETTREVHNTRSLHCITKTCKMAGNKEILKQPNMKTGKKKQKRLSNLQPEGGKQKKLTDSA